jgi:hypothetical protein
MWGTWENGISHPLRVEGRMIMKRVLIFVLAVIAPFFTTAGAAFAQHHTPYGHITALQTGSWTSLVTPIPADDTMAVDLDVEFVNSSERPVDLPPAGNPVPPSTPCHITTGGYALDPKDPGTKLNEAVLLSAYLARKRVSLFLDGCVFGKPRIVSVSMSISND